ncbi:MAG: hypothetical protein H6719_32845 [Sandaracinaceae bacterium]|nr:hypothetical protein [Sandaracinaceae bacterium]
MRLGILACVVALIAAGCDSGTPSSDDGGASGMDAGVGATDGGGAGTDGGAVDAGSIDAGEGSDGGAVDGGAGSDAGSTPIDGGGLCTPETPCTGGAICVGGPLCADGWSCIESDRPCTDDLVEYCGCDGATFSDSSTCPTRPFAHMGPCPGAAGFDCDRSRVTCRAVEPTCGPGLVAEVEGSCWTFRCVPLTDCGCTDGAQCPGDATCDASAMRCAP